MLRLGMLSLATAVALVALTPAARAAAPACPTIEFAALQAVGSKHASAQYVAYLNSAAADQIAVTFMVGFEGLHPTPPVRLALSPSESLFGRKNPAVIFVTPQADIAWIRIVSVQQGKTRPIDCSSTPRYVLKPTKIEAIAFDDSASWVHPYSVLQFMGAGQASVLAHENPAWRGMSGSCKLIAIVGADGVVKDAAVLDTSGDQELDEAAVKAVMQTRFHPARLPESAGGKAIASVVDLSLTFTPGLVSLHVH